MDEEPKKIAEKGPVYRDEQTGAVLYGYSQLDQDKLCKQIKILTLAFIIISVIVIVLAVVTLIWLMKTNYLTRILEALIQ